MKDASKLLNFNPDRELQFNAFRPVDFTIRRGLYFDIDRDLSFDSQRDLPFGKKGTKFRHFICGGCGSVVDGEAKRCPKCGAVFKSDEEAMESESKVDFSEEIRHSRMREYFGEEYEEGIESKREASVVYRCGSCGNNLRYIRTREKWYCDRCKIYIGATTRGAPKKVHRFTPSAGSRPGGVKFVVDQRARRRYPSEVMIVEDLNKRKRRR